MTYLIIGNGIAGISAAEAIRELDPSGAITMVSDEDALPYSRPMITYLLEGSCHLKQLPIRPSNFYDRLGINAILGRRVESMDVDQKTVMLSSGQTVSYDRLLIASGADPRPIDAEGMHLKNIFYMRTADHVKKQLEVLPNVKRAVVLGGGLVGFKSAYALMKQGVWVTMLITSGYPLSMQVDRVAGHMLLREMMAKGLEVKVGAKVVSFHGAIGSDKVRTVQLDTRQVLPCEMVIIGKGVSPSLSFVPRHRIATNVGIYVNDFMESSFPGIYAAGDVAECMDIARGDFWVNAIWPEAAIQGRIAGLNMAGREVQHPGGLSRNVMRVFDMDVMTIGMADARSIGKKEFQSVSSLSHGNYRNIIFKENVPVGAVLVNNIEQGGVIRSLIEQKRPVEEPLERLTSPHFNFAKLL